MEDNASESSNATKGNGTLGVKGIQVAVFGAVTAIGAAIMLAATAMYFFLPTPPRRVVVHPLDRIGSTRTNGDASPVVVDVSYVPELNRSEIQPGDNVRLTVHVRFHNFRYSSAKGDVSKTDLTKAKQAIYAAAFRSNAFRLELSMAGTIVQPDRLAALEDDSDPRFRHSSHDDDITGQVTWTIFPNPDNPGQLIGTIHPRLDAGKILENEKVDFHLNDEDGVELNSTSNPSVTITSAEHLISIRTALSTLTFVLGSILTVPGLYNLYLQFVDESRKKAAEEEETRKRKKEQERNSPEIAG